MRFLFEGLLIVFIGLGLGSVLSLVSVRENQGFGALKVGAWTAWPDAGSAQADPYTTAKIAADGNVPLGAAEGVAFTASADGENQPLRRECSYQLLGKMPQARIWTLTAQNGDGRVLIDRLERPSTVLSSNVVWQSDETLSITSSRSHATGNWLPVDGNGPMRFVMRVYDSPVTSGAAVAELVLPAIKRVSCQN